MAPAADAAAASPSRFRPPSLALATLGLSLGTFMQVLDMTIANVSLPTIAGNLSGSLDQSTWVITSFTVCQAITLPMTGFLSWRVGEVHLFGVAVLLFALFSLLCGFATSLPMLVLFRALQGAVCGPMYPITQSLMVEIYPRDKRGVVLPIIAMITVVAPIVGPVLGGWIIDSYSWRWIFFINVPLGLFASSLVFQQLGSAWSSCFGPEWTGSAWSRWCWAWVRCRSCPTRATSWTGLHPAPSPCSRWSPASRSASGSSGS